MKRKLAIAGSVLVLAFVALRVYGAYQQERDNALQQAAIAEQKAKELNEESDRLKQQSECNLLWLKYENAKLEREIAELRGRVAPRPVEPPCSGHAVRMDESLAMFSRQLQVLSAALQATDYARYARDYAASRKYQTRYLLIRLWAFLTGTEVRTKPAEMVGKIETAALHDNCMKRAKDDSQRKSCNEEFGQPAQSR